MAGPIPLPDRPRFFDDLPPDLDEDNCWGFYLMPVAIESVEARMMLLDQIRGKLKGRFSAFILVVWYDYTMREALSYLNQRPASPEEEYEFYKYLGRLGLDFENVCRTTSNFGNLLAALKNENVNRTIRAELPKKRRKANPMDAYLDEPWARFTRYYKTNFRR